METTILISKIIGPVLLLRGVSILLDRKHFLTMLDGLEREVNTVAFSLFPIALLMACISLAILHNDYSSLAAIFIQIIAWGGMVKTSALILFPRAVAAKARLIGRAGFIHVVWVVCLLVGGYFVWFGYFASRNA
ncbi:MAG TPA: hypothetical protein VID27_15405 [Blastocatellia bacterium]